MPMSDLDEIVAAVAASKKYRTVCRDTIRRLARQELAKRDSTKAAVKATKRRLHQVYSAFEEGIDYAAAYERLAAAYATGGEAKIRAACRELLARHSSTRERLPILDRFYPALWQITRRPGAVLDLGCGLNPLALPWMDLPADARLTPIDIDVERVDFLNRYLALAGRPSLARCQDLLADPPAGAPSTGSGPSVALLLKMSPSLERQAAGATVRQVESLAASFVVVSYAVQSLGGRDKGMAEHYEGQFLSWAAERHWTVEQLNFETELAFVVKRKA